MKLPQRLPHQFITIASANMSPYTPQIVLTIRGPRGGTKAYESISLDEAKKLMDALREAVGLLTA